MSKSKKMICGILAILAVMQLDNGLAAAKDNVPEKEQQSKKAAVSKKQQKSEAVVPKSAPAPIVLEGEDIAFDESTGEVLAKGHVKVTQEAAKLVADEMIGNMQTYDVWIEDKAHITQLIKPLIDIDGYAAHYNYQDRRGSMEKFAGIADERFVRGERMEFFPEQIIIYNGEMTKCPAKKPDYHMSASKIEIWPNDKLIAYDAKFWVKDKVIYATKRYVTKLGKQQKNPYPSVGYNSDDGAYIVQRMEAPLGEKLTGTASIGYYSKRQFKNSYGLQWNEQRYYTVLETGDFQDDDGNWMRKNSNFRLSYPPQKIRDTKVSYFFNAEYGKWSDQHKTSWHQDYELYFSYDPIKLSDTLSLHLGAGYQIIKESYDKSNINTLKYDISLSKVLSPKLSVWTGYHYTKNDYASALFNFNNATAGKELASGLAYRFDRKNALVISQSYDIGNKRVADMDYTWYRDLHCVQASLMYRQKRSQLRFDLSVTRW